MNAAGREREAGFTLMESLIAVVILAGIAAVLVPAVRTAVRVEARTSSLVGGLETQATVEELMRDVLLRAYRPPRADAAGRLTGSPTSVRFLTLAVASDSPEPVSIGLDADRLELSLQRLDGARRTAQTVLLADQVERIRFQYFGDAADGRGPGWHEAWDFEVPPRLIALDLLARDGSVQRIEASIGGAGAFDCRFDSGQGICLGDMP